VPTPEQVRTGGVRSPALTAEYERSRVEVGGAGPRALLENFVRASAGVEPLLSSASDGLRSIELSSALLASGLTERTVELSADPGRHPRLPVAVRPS